MNRAKLAKIKTKIENRLPEAILATTTIVATSYALHLKINEIRGKGTIRLAIDDRGVEVMKSGHPIIWEEKGQRINLAYDPNC